MSKNADAFGEVRIRFRQADNLEQDISGQMCEEIETGM
jgi:hypothetical protein